MAYILTCGCKSDHEGYFAEWDTETRECLPAIAYGCLCAKHYAMYEARPPEYEQPEENKVAKYEE